MNDLIWIAMVVDDHRGGAEYYGRMTKADFDDVISGKRVDSFVKVDHLTWLDSENTNQCYKFSEIGKQQGVDYGYGDTAYFHITQITRMIPLRDEFVTSQSL